MSNTHLISLEEIDGELEARWTCLNPQHWKIGCPFQLGSIDGNRFASFSWYEVRRVPGYYPVQLDGYPTTPAKIGEWE